MQITLETLRNKEARDALIDDLIRMMVDGHIVTVLDFIPVEERLPESGRIVFASTKMGPIVPGYVDTAGRWMHGSFQNCPIGTVPHWAEIPKI